jgi:6-phosphogluconolactonase
MAVIPFFVGSYSMPSPWAGAPEAHGAGIVIADLDTDSGAVHVRSSHYEINPSFLVRSGPDGLLWAITEPEKGGEVVAFREDAACGLDLVGRLDTGADAPCHVAIDPTCRLAFAAHYHGGLVSTLAFDGDGRPAAVLALTQPPGNVAGEDRSARLPRPHATLIAGESEVIVTDTGRDLILLYHVVAQGHGLRLELLDALVLPTGTGPRHLAQASGGNIVYVSNQNSGGVSIVERVADAERPRLLLRGLMAERGLDRADPVPSEIAIHPTLGVVYLANRKDDSLSIFAIDAGSDRLQSCGAVAWAKILVISPSPLGDSGSSSPIRIPTNSRFSTLRTTASALSGMDSAQPSPVRRSSSSEARPATPARSLPPDPRRMTRRSCR